MAIYLNPPKSTMKGNVSTKGFDQWIEIDDIEFGGVTKPVTMVVGQSMNRQAGNVRMGQVTLLKSMDNSSNGFFEAAHDSNACFDHCEFHYVKHGDGGVTTYGKLILDNVVVTHFSDKYSPALKRPVERINLAYTKMQRTVTSTNGNNTAGNPSTTGFDVEANKKM